MNQKIQKNASKPTELPGHTHARVSAGCSSNTGYRTPTNIGCRAEGWILDDFNNRTIPITFATGSEDGSWWWQSISPHGYTATELNTGDCSSYAPSGDPCQVRITRFYHIR